MGLRKSFVKTTGGVTSVNGRTGKVTMPAAMMQPYRHTFAREYADGESIQLVDLPANCKVFRIYMSEFPEFASVSADVGTIEDSQKFGQAMFSASGYAMNGVPKLVEITQATKFVLTFTDAFNGTNMTQNLTGKTVDIVIEYVENEVI